MRRSIVGALAFMLIPVFWISLNIIGVRITFVDMYKEWSDYKNSGKPWGRFDA